MRILIADDDFDVRLLLSRTVQKWGHEVLTAEDGAEALELIKSENITFVISDWMMPNMDGLELCRNIRELDEANSGYTYVILLTAKESKTELIQGMDAGADDFVTKPFDKDVLKVRVRAGERILELKENLDEKNKKLTAALQTIEKDLVSASKMQKGLLAPTPSTLSNVRFDSIYIQCSFVSGDIYNFFQFDEDHIGFYLLDVAGHGIPSAMQSVTLSRAVNPLPEQTSLLKRYISELSKYEVVNPALAVSRLNEQFQADEDTMLYFTMVYGIINTKTGLTKLTQAGHPSPIFVHNDGGVKFIGDGGFPVGMLPGVEFDEHELYLHKGDRLFLYSDGVTECTGENNELFSEERLLQTLQEERHSPLKDTLATLEDSLRLWHNQPEFEDDVTLLAIEII